MFYLLCTSLQKRLRDLWFLWEVKRPNLCSVAKKYRSSFPHLDRNSLHFCTLHNTSMEHMISYCLCKHKKLVVVCGPTLHLLCMYVQTDRWCDYVQALGVGCLCNNNNNNKEGFASMALCGKLPVAL